MGSGRSNPGKQYPFSLFQSKSYLFYKFLLWLSSRKKILLVARCSLDRLLHTHFLFMPWMVDIETGFGIDDLKEANTFLKTKVVLKNHFHPV